MSRFITAIIIFIIIIVVCIVSLSYVSNKESVLLIYIDDMEQHAQNNDMQNALESAIAFSNQLNKIQSRIIMLMRHETINELIVQTSKLVAYAKTGNISEYLAQVYCVRALLIHTCEDEKPLIHNFL